MTDSPVKPSEYNKVVARAVLVSITLTNSRFELKPEVLEGDHRTWKNSVQGGCEHASYDPETGRLYGLFDFEAVCRQSRKRVLAANAQYLARYQVNAECDAAAAELFVVKVGRFACYPYFRSLFANLTSQGNIIVPPLPIIGAQPRTIKSAEDLEEFGPVKALAASK